MKNLLFDYLNAQLAPYREEYVRLLDAPDHVEAVLLAGASRVRAISEPFMQQVRQAVGIRPLA